MALKIYGVLRSRATRNVWLARELGLAFEHVPVVQGYRLADPSAPDAPLNTTSPAFLAINPNGQIPCMDDDGFVLTESMAINLYLARRHGGPLGPADLQEDALMTSWSFWAVSQCETHALDILYNRVGRPPQERNEAVAQAAEVALRRPFRVLEQSLAKGGGHPVGGRFTVADINIAEVLRYAQASPGLFDSHPAVKEWLANCQARPVFTQMMAERNAEPA
jgi:glutathione S-transferase